MNGRVCACWTFALIVSAPLTTVFGAEDHLLSYSGTATAHSGAFLYSEQHLLKYRDGRLAERIVLYTCHDGAAFARKSVTYVEPMSPDFELDDAANGMREGVRSEGNVRTVFFRGVRVEPEKTGSVRQVQGLVIDAGFDEFIRANWPALMSGKPLDLNFLVPSRLEAMRFEAQRLRSDALDGVAVDVFRLKLSGVLGWALPGIDVFYGSESHLLMRYEGLSDLRDSVGENFQTTIRFDPADRKPAEESQWSNARQAPLGPCR